MPITLCPLLIDCSSIRCRGALGLPEVRLSSGGSTSSLGLPSSAAPSARGLTFATINAETLETAARDADFPVPAEEVIDKVRGCQCHM